MFDFVTFDEVVRGRGDDRHIAVVPSFIYGPSKDLMIRGGAFYAIWDETAGVWRKSTHHFVRLVDEALREYVSNMPEERREMARPSFLRLDRSQGFPNFLRFCKNSEDMWEPLDQKVLFKSDPRKRDDYSTKTLSYDMVDQPTPAYDELFGTLYEPDELQKLEWGMGAVIDGGGHYLQKMWVLYGAPGTGKSTWLDLLTLMFDGYAQGVNVGQMDSGRSAFGLSSLKNDPVVGYEHEGDLSGLTNNSVLNSVLSHNSVEVNLKYQAPYQQRFTALLFVGTNKEVKFTDINSGLTRRVIDINPSGNKIEFDKYSRLVAQLRFELGGIAHRCLAVYRRLGLSYYANYVATSMLYATNTLHNFVAEYEIELSEEPVTLRKAWSLYKLYCADANDTPLKMREFRTQMTGYYREYRDRVKVDGVGYRSVFLGFKYEKLYPNESPRNENDEIPPGVILEEGFSLLDEVLADCPAQYANERGTPTRKWSEVTTTLKDLDTSRLHYVKPPKNHIVIDFDLTNEKGEKDLDRNLEAASRWPLTYSETSQGGAGLHLHYTYAGDVDGLSRLFGPGIEIKVFVGDASLRRRVSRSSSREVVQLSSGLPLRPERMITAQQIMSEKGLRALIERNLRKEIHPGTKPSVDFIHKILTDAYESGVSYDVSDLKSRIVGFASNSSHQAIYCLRLVKNMPFKSREDLVDGVATDDERLVFFDCEVFVNLFVICWKYEGSGETVRMVNPLASDVAELFSMRLVGYNNRKYDNHILYAASLGYSTAQLYELSQKIVSNDRSVLFPIAYNLSFADIYDFLSKKQSLKKWQIELGMSHKEVGLPWDQPVADEMVADVVEYCVNDVETEEQLFKARHADFVARQILADLSGLAINKTTNTHSAAIIFEGEKNPQGDFNYTDLSEMFPGYKHEFGVSTYREIVVGEGGYVYGEPGAYEKVVCYDVAGMHPASIRALELFGPRYTKNFGDLVDARLIIKHANALFRDGKPEEAERELSKAREMLDGKLAKHLTRPEDLDGLSWALKIVVNSVYGLTAASFDNPFRDLRNVDNIVAKRGALFMVELAHELRLRGARVVHIKTDSIKLVDPDEETDRFVKEFGLKYGYNFEIEAEYERLVLVNNAVYVGRKKNGRYQTVGAQFQHPVVFKTLFSGEACSFDDYAETKTVQTAMWLDFDGDKSFVGRAGSFVPVLSGGGDLLRAKEGGFDAVNGSKGHKWVETEVERARCEGRLDNLDLTYHNGLIEKAVENLSKFEDPMWVTQ